MRMLLSRLGGVLCTVWTITACVDDVPTAPATAVASLTPAIVDGAHGDGNPHFFFLPPLVRAANHGGTFDATLDPIVEVCALGPDEECAGAPVATFTTSGAGSERVRVDRVAEHYLVNWHPRRGDYDPAIIYRISVRIGELRLGYLDAWLGERRGARRSEAIVAIGGTIPIKFRIESGALTPPAKPVWTFTILGAVSQRTAEYLGGFEAAKRFMRAQVDTLNSRFNTPGVFAGEFRWVLDSIEEYTGTGMEQVTKPHPGFDYKYIVDGYQGPGGWWGDYDVVFLSWPIDQITTPGATDAIVHEFGHARGAIDTYAIKVDPENDPITHLGFHPGRSIMDYPYGETMWDLHSINLINRSADVVHAPPSYITESFPPSIVIVVVDETGARQPGVDVVVFPVLWFQARFDIDHAYQMRTDSNGEMSFPWNPFEPGTPAPWLMKYPNFLVTSGVSTSFGYVWMPITDVQNHWFADPTTPYRLQLVVRAR